MSVSVIVGANAPSSSIVAAPGGTDTSRKWKRTAIKTETATQSGGMVNSDGQVGTSASAFTLSAIGVSTTPGNTKPT